MEYMVDLSAIELDKPYTVQAQCAIGAKLEAGQLPVGKDLIWVVEMTERETPQYCGSLVNGCYGRFGAAHVLYVNTTIKSGRNVRFVRDDAYDTGRNERDITCTKGHELLHAMGGKHR